MCECNQQKQPASMLPDNGSERGKIWERCLWCKKMKNIGYPCHHCNEDCEEQK